MKDPYSGWAAKDLDSGFRRNDGKEGVVCKSSDGGGGCIRWLRSITPIRTFPIEGEGLRWIPSPVSGHEDRLFAGMTVWRCCLQVYL